MTGSRTEDSTNLATLRAAYGAFVIALAGSAVAIWASAADRSDRIFGLGVAAALFGIGFGLVAWSKSLNLEEATQDREPLTLSEADREALNDEAILTAQTVGRRPLLVWIFGGTLLTALAGILSPILSLGPSTRGSRGRTEWAAGRRLVTSDGEPILAATGIVDALVTVFPENHTRADDSQVVLMRVSPDLIHPETVDAGAIDGWIAYSKICTHLGCSVGLLGIDTRAPLEVRQLVCPCHQSIFDPLAGAKPIGGPAPRPLPQLPLAIDGEGYLVATRDFDVPVGPVTWNEG